MGVVVAMEAVVVLVVVAVVMVVVALVVIQVAAFAIIIGTLENVNLEITANLLMVTLIIVILAVAAPAAVATEDIVVEVEVTEAAAMYVTNIRTKAAVSGPMIVNLNMPKEVMKITVLFVHIARLVELIMRFAIIIVIMGSVDLVKIVDFYMIWMVMELTMMMPRLLTKRMQNRKLLKERRVNLTT